MNDKQLGKIRVCTSEIRRHPAEMAEFFAALKLIPIRADWDYRFDTIEYTAISDRFDEIDEGAEVPRYTTLGELDDEGQLIDVTVERVNGHV